MIYILFKKFINTLEKEGVREAFAKAYRYIFFRDSGQVTYSLNYSEEYPYTHGYERIPEKIADLLRKNPDKSVVLIVGQCLCREEGSKIRQDKIIKQLLAKDFLVIRVDSSSSTEVSAREIRERNKSFFEVNFIDKKIWKSLISNVALESSNKLFYYLAGNEQITDIDDLKWLQSLGYTLVCDYKEDMDSDAFHLASKKKSQPYDFLVKNPSTLFVSLDSENFDEGTDFYIGPYEEKKSCNITGIDSLSLISKGWLSSSDKILTLVVPTYNMEKYLNRCVDSMILPALLSSLEILLINDGSTDSSLEIALEYERKYPKTIRVYDKENGGHGSCINVGIREAKGKYLKLVDSDDWLDPLALKSHVNKLAVLDNDIFITNYRRVVVGNEFTDVDYSCLLREGRYLAEKLYGELLHSNNHLSYAHMHSITYKTENIRNSKVEITEHSFYVDQEYISLPLTNVHDAYYQNIFLYRYFIGRKDQSVSPGQIRKNIDANFKILLNIISFYYTLPKSQVPLRRYILNIIYQQASFYCLYSSNRENKVFLREFIASKNEKLANNLS